MDIEEVLFLWFISFFDKKSSGGGINDIWNEKLAEELHKPIIKNKIKKWEFILHLKTIFWVLI